MWLRCVLQFLYCILMCSMLCEWLVFLVIILLLMGWKQFGQLQFVLNLVDDLNSGVLQQMQLQMFWFQWFQYLFVKGCLVVVLWVMWYLMLESWLCYLVLDFVMVMVMRFFVGFGNCGMEVIGWLMLFCCVVVVILIGVDQSMVLVLVYYVCLYVGMLDYDEQFIFSDDV